MNAKPKIVCLCGSTKFYKQFQIANFEETLKGNIVLSVGFYPHSSKEAHGENIGITEEQKLKLDELHKRKIDISDEILVINVGGYIGDSTRSEIEYAKKLKIPIRYQEAIGAFEGEWMVGGQQPPLGQVVEILMKTGEINFGFLEKKFFKNYWSMYKAKGDSRRISGNDIVGWRETNEKIH